MQLEWISAAEGRKFAHVMQKLEELRRTVTPEEIAQARAALTAKAKPASAARAAQPAASS